MKSLLIGRCDSHRVHADEQSCCCLPEPYGRFVVADCSSGLTFIDTCLGLILERGGENDGRDLATQSHLYAHPTKSSEVNKIGLLDFSLYPSEICTVWVGSSPQGLVHQNSGDRRQQCT